MVFMGGSPPYNCEIPMQSQVPMIRDSYKAKDLQTSRRERPLECRYETQLAILSNSSQIIE